jgi:ketosteroid isomerase-like protein
MDDRAQIEHAEGRLRAAMLASDVATLDVLLSPDMIFTNQVGARLDKGDDLGAHQSGLLRIEQLDPIEPLLIRLLGDSAVVCVTVQLSGSYDAQPFSGTFAYTRCWHRLPGDQWRIEAAHCSPVVRP